MSREINKPVNVLQVTIGDGSYGGVTSFMYSYYSHIDHSKVHFDFLYCGENSMQSKIKSSAVEGSMFTTLHIMKPRENGVFEYRKLLAALRRFFSRNNYDVVHVNTSNIYVCVCVALTLERKSTLIIHSHSTNLFKRGNKIKTAIKAFLKLLCQEYIQNKADYYFACSYAAGENLFGKGVFQSARFKIIRNAIDVHKFSYNPEIRDRYRKTNRLIIGHVGRFSSEKNHALLIDIYYKFYAQNKESELWLIGDGELREKIEGKVKRLGLEKNVVFWGQRDDVACLMQAMDVFLLPSFYEGLSIVSIEAQASGLPVYASNTCSPEHQITELIQFLPINSGPQVWAERLLKDVQMLPQRRDMSKIIQQKGYEIDNAAKCLEQDYMKMIEQRQSNKR